MSFSDDDFARLKKLIAADHEVGESGTHESERLEAFYRVYGRALLTRLEAAEMVVTTPHLHGLVFTSRSCPGCRATKIWRKAAGK